ncbi:type II toxin-antitoxin system HipA family toxin [uncultured Bacteroides sp.]|uniref:type II toxin-antitoxin system HipA family toxin n=1 Tax=uncultured Bacteroides sp. TaxID=162156 RepID=UPI002AA8504E|nr:type II toxin-antitoxin system HipA family toxin [uncultured Bacteroides sp.]
METNVVKVKLWGMDVGYLSWDKEAGVAVFEYEPSFLKRGLDIAPLTMSINSPRSQKQLPWTGDKEKLYQGLPPMIADSLPDKWGNSLFKAWLRDNHVSIKTTTPVDHLSFIDSRAMGALEYEPAHKLGNNSTFAVDVQKLYAFAKQVLNERETTVLNQENSILWQDLVELSSSPGGKRPKAIVALNQTTEEVISGQGVIPEGFQHYILKYDDNSAYPFAKLEYIYYRMALDAGIEMMPSELRTYGNVTHFLTQRFDRIGNDKVHTQTLAAMSLTSDSYEDLFAVIRRLHLPYEDSKQQYLRMVFNVIARNVDDHSKNFSFCMNRDGAWRLSPAYDLTYSVDPTAPAYSNTHSLTVNGKNENITREDLETVGLNNDIQDYKALLDTVANAIAQFEGYAKELGINEKLIESMLSDFVKV